MGGRANLDALVPTWFICHWLDVSKQTVNYWVSAGKLTPAARDGHGRPLYRYGDVLAVERDTRRSGKSRRRARMNRSAPTRSLLRFCPLGSQRS